MDDIDNMDYELPAGSTSKPKVVSDRSPYREWACLYPIYLDAKRPHKLGQRRISHKYALQAPLINDMANAAVRLGLQVFIEPDKTHPQDWANPGRIRIMIKRNGKAVHPLLTDKYKVMQAIACQLKPQDKPTDAPPAQQLPYNSPALSHGILQGAVAHAASQATPAADTKAPAVPPNIKKLKKRVVVRR